MKIQEEAKQPEKQSPHQIKPSMVKLSSWLFVLIVYLAGCIKSSECEPAFFMQKNEKDTSVSYFFALKKDTKNGDCGYKHELRYWKGVSKEGKFLPAFGMSGFIYEKNDIIFLLPNGFTKPVKYFDFGMHPHSKETIAYTFKALGFDNSTVEIKKSYELRLDSLFYDSNKSDTIYKFRFYNFAIEGPNNDLVFYIGKKVGAVGLYSSYLNDSIEEIDSFRGEIYLKQLDSSKVLVRHRH